MSSPELQHLLSKARDAVTGGDDTWYAMSTDEKLAGTLVLNRADWLREMGYTMAEAISRCESCVTFIPLVETALRDEELLPLNAS
jgi:hypothetical protein